MLSAALGTNAVQPDVPPAHGAQLTGLVAAVHGEALPDTALLPPSNKLLSLSSEIEDADNYDNFSGIDEEGGTHLIFGDNEDIDMKQNDDDMSQNDDDPQAIVATATLSDPLDVLDDPVGGRNSDLVQN